jgi:hypothetical protein
MLHEIKIKEPSTTFIFNGDFNKPTFGRTQHYKEWAKILKKFRVMCDYSITDGWINFNKTCTHALAQTRVPLPGLPKYF